MLSNPSKINFVCRVLQPLNDNPEDKFVFEIFYRDQIVITDGQMHSDIVSCTNALCKTISKLADHDNKNIYEPISIILNY